MMRKFIHGQTIKKYLKDYYCIDSDSFTDNAKNETKLCCIFEACRSCVVCGKRRWHIGLYELKR